MENRHNIVAESENCFETKRAREQQFSWSWAALSEKEVNILVSKLSLIGQHSINLYAVSPASRNLATSLDEAFARAGWKQYLSAGPPIAGMVVGICVAQDGVAATAIKEYIETSTAHKVSIRNLRGANTNGTLELVIGVKPIPSPIPLELKDEIATLGQKLKSISSEILIFSADRKREEALLPNRESYSSDINDVSQWHQRGISFGNETKSLYHIKFSGHTSPYLAQLINMGIGLPFFLQNAESRPEILGKWFAVVGDLLVRGEIDEARNVGNDNHIWFG